jgi:hypothetical protein
VAAVRQLVAHFGAEHVFILSKCSTRVQQATVVWLGSNEFFARTGAHPGARMHRNNRHRHPTAA